MSGCWDASNCESSTRTIVVPDNKQPDLASATMCCPRQRRAGEVIEERRDRWTNLGHSRIMPRCRRESQKSRTEDPAQRKKEED